MSRFFVRAMRNSAACLMLATMCFGPRRAMGADSSPAAQIRVPKDFKAELLYSVPQGSQGSWVAMCVDPKGRLIVSDQYGKLYRVTLPSLDRTDGISMEAIDLPVGQAQGLLYAFDSLYVMNANDAFQGRGLYRVRDTNGDDKYDEVKLLRKLEGGGEHGPHAILLSPDGKSLHIVSGNQTKVPVIDSSRVPKHWSEDHLLPRMWDGNGFMKGTLGPGGWIAKTDPEGKSWELVASGFRNEYDAAFNREGDLFTYDADMEWDLNTPWYRPTRVNLVTSGAEFGWRSGAGKWPAYYPDSLGAVVNIGPGSPTGVTFGHGAKFPTKYQEALFICDWSFGKLYAVHLSPEGAGYTGQAEEFISGSPLALTDLVIHPKDGAMYFAVGGRKTQSGLYRVTYTGTESTAPAVADPRGKQLRNLRREIESFHGRVDPKAVKMGIAYIGYPDRYLRFAARIALEHQPVNTWREEAFSLTAPTAVTHAMIALARSSAVDRFHRATNAPAPDKGLQGRILAKLDGLNWRQLSESQRLDLLRAYSLAFTRFGEPDNATRERQAARWEPLFPTQSRELNAELAAMIVYLEAPTAATKLSAALAKAPSQEEQMEYARAMRVLKTGWNRDQRTAYFNWFLKAANFRGGASLTGFLRDMKADAVATLSPEEKTALQSVLDAKPQSKKVLENLLTGRTAVKDWKVADLANGLASGLKNRNFDHGRELFGAVGCYNCHRFDSEGAAVGPDLTGIGGRFSPRDLLESIVDPNKEISDQYGQVVITRKDGETVLGRIGNLNQETLMIITDMFDPNGFASVKRSDITSIDPSKVSPMPEGLLNTMKEDEIHDLLAFILSRGDRNNPMFSK